jgi:hypothetical protein
VRWYGLLLTIVAAAATARFAPAVAEAAPPTLLRAGYLAITSPKHAVGVTVVAPRLRCPKTGRRAVGVGAFGTLTETYQHKTSTHAWAAMVRTVCTNGVEASNAIFTNHVNASTRMHVTPGDRVNIVVHRAQYWVMSDITAGYGGAGAGSLPPGKHIAVNSRVLFGLQLSSPTMPHWPLHVLSAHNGGRSLSALHPVARLARQGNRVIARPTAIQPKTGAFYIKHT